MYGQDILDQVADQSRQIAERLDASSEIPVEVRWLPVVTSSDEIARVEHHLMRYHDWPLEAS